VCSSPSPETSAFLSLGLRVSEGRDWQRDVYREPRKITSRRRQWQDCLGDPESRLLLWRDFYPQHGYCRQPKDCISEIRRIL